MIIIKKCTKCGREKDESFFKTYFSKRDNKYVIYSRCKECTYKEENERRNKIRKELINNGLRKCKKCKCILKISDFSIYNQNRRCICNECLNPKIITKICNKCNIEKNEDEFYSCHKNGKNYTRNTCIECFNAKRSHLYSFYEIDEILNTNVKGV